ncbi:MAG TPA: C40 family peptidase [Rhizomicrobium sp.]|jgi:cell wall-associated NlpC family hydrolase
MSDARITPARGDIAAASLRGKVDAKIFVEGEQQIIATGRTGLRAGPSATSGMASEVLFGETVTVYECRDGWAWVQCALDDYVGYLREDVLAAPLAPTHRVLATSTPLLPAPDVKRPALDLLPMNAMVQVIGHEGRFAQLASRGFIYADHLVPLDDKQQDWVATAERFTNTPYIWGGKTATGMDCSGLVQTALQPSGLIAPRDSDMQEKALGKTVEDLSRPQRGDLIFWKGHVGIMLDGARMLHANAYSMNVTIERLAEAINRIARSGSEVTNVKRL